MDPMDYHRNRRHRHYSKRKLFDFRCCQKGEQCPTSDFQDDYRNKYRKPYDKRDKFYYDRHTNDYRKSTYHSERWLSNNKDYLQHEGYNSNRVQNYYNRQYKGVNNKRQWVNRERTPEKEWDRPIMEQNNLSTEELSEDNDDYTEDNTTRDIITEEISSEKNKENIIPEEEFCFNFVVTPEDIIGSNSNFPSAEETIKTEPIEDVPQDNQETSNCQIEVPKIKCEPQTIACQENKTISTNNDRIIDININKRIFVNLLLEAKNNNHEGLNNELAKISAKIIDAQDEVIINLLQENNNLRNLPNNLRNLPKTEC